VVKHSSTAEDGYVGSGGSVHVGFKKMQTTKNKDPRKQYSSTTSPRIGVTTVNGCPLHSSDGRVRRQPCTTRQATARQMGECTVQADEAAD